MNRECFHYADMSERMAQATSLDSEINDPHPSEITQ